MLISNNHSILPVGAFALVALATTTCSGEMAAVFGPRDAETPLDVLPSIVDAPPDVAPPSPLGTWRSCDTTVRFLPEGVWEEFRLHTACRSSGRWALRGDRLDVRVDASTCAGRPPDLNNVQVSIQPDWLMIMVPAKNDAGFVRYLSDATPHVRWRLTGNRHQGTTGTTIVSLVGDPGRGGSGCYWSGDGDCNGIFSCGGTVYQWQTTGGVLSAGLNCSGCTCGSSLVGTISSDRLEGRYNAQNCVSLWQGTMIGTVEPDDVP